MAKNFGINKTVVKITTLSMGGGGWFLSSILLGGIIFLSFGLLSYFSTSLFITANPN
jgi:hypothetical protein